jgi:broad specificity phosphatase PhoE
MTLFVLLRHGQTEWNRQERFRGRADLALDETGTEQAKAAGRRIAAQYHPDAIYVSPLKRAMQTAAIVGEFAGLPVRPHQGLLDIDFGLWQGMSIAEAHDRWPDLVDAWQSRPGGVQIPGGERLADVRQRGLAAVSELAQSYPDQTVVIVGHLVINRAILLGVLGLDDDAFWRLGQDTCAISAFKPITVGYALLSLNDTCHLAGGW